MPIIFIYKITEKSNRQNKPYWQIRRRPYMRKRTVAITISACQRNVLLLFFLFMFHDVYTNLTWTLETRDKQFKYAVCFYLHLNSWHLAFVGTKINIL